ncbi:MAG: DNA-binding protein [Nitrososphaeraceae archaeon]|jgi:DNA-binding TFAR19-related protein (PDSD5 family)|nr:DNA-binding protein [Nitrososphaeraceae archaeon]
MNEDRDIEILKAKKMKEIMERMVKQQKEKTLKEMKIKNISLEKEAILSYLYDRGDEVLALAELQFPDQTRIIIGRILELIKEGEITKKISGGELLSLFRSLGLNIKVKTTIKIEDHGKYVSFADKLKQDKENDNV